MCPISVLSDVRGTGLRAKTIDTVLLQEHGNTGDAARLRARLAHVYWIGGGSGAGKSTIARRVAGEHSLHLYATDDVMPDHAGRMLPESLRT
jgi:hypothetical protein